MNNVVTPNISLNNGVSIPAIGFGVFKVDPAETKRIVLDALEVGYRHIDTAKIYENEKAVGEAIAESGISRDEIFVTTKLWNTDQGKDTSLPAFNKSLDELGLDYVDLYLIHWPAPKRDTYVESYHVLENILASGRTRSIGVSNFHVDHLERLLSESSVVPAVNQVERHPYFQRRDLVDYCHNNGIKIESWGPLSQGKSDLLENNVVTGIANDLGVTPAQVVLAWHVAEGTIVFPKTTSKARMVENLAAREVILSKEQHELINSLDQDRRLSAHPDDLN